MRQLFILSFVSLLTACASVQHTPAQAYRFSGNDEPVTITSKLDAVEGLTYKANLTVYFNGEPQITGPLGNDLSGELQGKAWQGKPTSVSCSSRRFYTYSGPFIATCSVFVGNERTVVLTFTQQ